MTPYVEDNLGWIFCYLEPKSSSPTQKQRIEAMTLVRRAIDKTVVAQKLCLKLNVWMRCPWEKVYEICRLRIWRGQDKILGNNKHWTGQGEETYIGDPEDMAENKEYERAEHQEPEKEKD